MGNKSVLAMAGQVGVEKTLLQSTANDLAEREATLLILGKHEIQIDFTACVSRGNRACQFTPVGSRVIVNKTPNFMETDAF